MRRRARVNGCVNRLFRGVNSIFSGVTRLFVPVRRPRSSTLWSATRGTAAVRSKSLSGSGWTTVIGGSYIGAGPDWGKWRTEASNLRFRYCFRLVISCAKLDWPRKMVLILNFRASSYLRK